MKFVFSVSIFGTSLKCFWADLALQLSYKAWKQIVSLWSLKKVTKSALNVHERQVESWIECQSGLELSLTLPL